jgi:hypothetical protein
VATETLLSCSNCLKPLVKFAVTPKDGPSGPISFNVQATCCYCGDASFVTNLGGVFQYMGYCEPNPDAPDDPDLAVEKTDVVNITQTKDRNGRPVQVFHTREHKHG